MKNNRKGFTLIELLVVIAIIALLSTLAVISLSAARQGARDSKRVADLKTIQTAVEVYASDNAGKYPAIDLTPTWAELQTLIGEYLQEGNLPKDPQPKAISGQLYLYCVDTSATNDKYMLADTLEGDIASTPAGDLDGVPASYAVTECVKESDGNPSAIPSCDDPAYCLGKL